VDYSKLERVYYKARDTYMTNKRSRVLYNASSVYNTATERVRYRARDTYITNKQNRALYNAPSVYNTETERVRSVA